MLFDQYENKKQTIVLKMHLLGGKKKRELRTMCLRNYCKKKKQSEDNTKPVKEKIRNSSFNLKNYWKKKIISFQLKQYVLIWKKTIFKGKCILTKKISILN